MIPEPFYSIGLFGCGLVLGGIISLIFLRTYVFVRYVVLIE
jgi:hypothetical protein